jgi:hypothetical protein
MELGPQIDIDPELCVAEVTEFGAVRFLRPSCRTASGRCAEAILA